MLSKYRDFLLVLINKFGSAFVGLGITVYFAREASIEVFGEYSLAMSLVFIFSSLYCSGCPNLIVSKSPLMCSFNLNRMNDVILRRCIKACLYSLPFFLLTPLIYKSITPSLLLFILICGLSRSITEVSSAFLRAHGHQVMGVIFDSLLRPMVFLIFLLICSGEIIGEYYILGLTTSFIIMALLSCIALKVIVFDKFMSLKLFFVKKNRMANLWNMEANDFLYITIFQVLGRHADILVIGLLMSNNDIAVYSISVKLAAVVMYVMVASGSVLAPKLSMLKGQDNNIISKCLVGYNKVTSVIGLVFIMTFILFGELFIGIIFGQKYQNITDLLIVALGLEYVIVILGNSSVAMNMLGYSKENYIYFRSATIIQLVLLAPSIYFFNLWGALLCMSICRTVYRLRLCAFLHKKGISVNYWAWLYRQRLKRTGC